MSNDLNNCHFIGRMTDAPELRHAGDTPVTNFTLACGWKTKDKDGVEYIRCVAYNRTAEIIAEYMVKGQQCYVSGRQTTRKYEKDGSTRYSTEIVVDRLQMLAKPAGQAESKPKQSQPLADMDDDLPFN